MVNPYEMLWNIQVTLYDNVLGLKESTYYTYFEISFNFEECYSLVHSQSSSVNCVGGLWKNDQVCGILQYATAMGRPKGKRGRKPKVPVPEFYEEEEEEESSDPVEQLLSLYRKEDQFSEQLENLERQIYAFEGSYLEESNVYGNIITGFKRSTFRNPVVGSTYTRYNNPYKPHDRIFSLSSLTYQTVVTGTADKDALELQPFMTSKSSRDYDDDGCFLRPPDYSKFKGTPNVNINWSGIQLPKRKVGRPRKNDTTVYQNASKWLAPVNLMQQNIVGEKRKRGRPSKRIQPTYRFIDDREPSPEKIEAVSTSSKLEVFRKNNNARAARGTMFSKVAIKPRRIPVYTEERKAAYESFPTVKRKPGRPPKNPAKLQKTNANLDVTTSRNETKVKKSAYKSIYTSSEDDSSSDTTSDTKVVSTPSKPFIVPTPQRALVTDKHIATMKRLQSERRPTISDDDDEEDDDKNSNSSDNSDNSDDSDDNKVDDDKNDEDKNDKKEEEYNRRYSSDEGVKFTSTAARKLSEYFRSKLNDERRQHDKEEDMSRWDDRSQIASHKQKQTNNACVDDSLNQRFEQNKNFQFTEPAVRAYPHSTRENAKQFDPYHNNMQNFNTMPYKGHPEDMEEQNITSQRNEGINKYLNEQMKRQYNYNSPYNTQELFTETDATVQLPPIKELYKKRVDNKATTKGSEQVENIRRMMEPPLKDSMRLGYPHSNDEDNRMSADNEEEAMDYDKTPISQPRTPNVIDSAMPMEIDKEDGSKSDSSVSSIECASKHSSKKRSKKSKRHKHRESSEESSVSEHFHQKHKKKKSKKKKKKKKKKYKHDKCNKCNKGHHHEEKHHCCEEYMKQHPYPSQTGSGLHGQGQDFSYPNNPLLQFNPNQVPEDGLNSKWKLPENAFTDSTGYWKDTSTIPGVFDPRSGVFTPMTNLPGFDASNFKPPQKEKEERKIKSPVNVPPHSVNVPPHPVNVPPRPVNAPPHPFIIPPHHKCRGRIPGIFGRKKQSIILTTEFFQKYYEVDEEARKNFKPINLLKRQTVNDLIKSHNDLIERLSNIRIPETTESNESTESIKPTPTPKRKPTPTPSSSFGTSSLYKRAEETSGYMNTDDDNFKYDNIPPPTPGANYDSIPPPTPGYKYDNVPPPTPGIPEHSIINTPNTYNRAGISQYQPDYSQINIQPTNRTGISQYQPDYSQINIQPTNRAGISQYQPDYSQINTQPANRTGISQYPPDYSQINIQSANRAGIPQYQPDYSHINIQPTNRAGVTQYPPDYGQINIQPTNRAGVTQYPLDYGHNIQPANRVGVTQYPPDYGQINIHPANRAGVAQYPPDYGQINIQPANRTGISQYQPDYSEINIQPTHYVPYMGGYSEDVYPTVVNTPNVYQQKPSATINSRVGSYGPSVSPVEYMQVDTDQPGSSRNMPSSKFSKGPSLSSSRDEPVAGPSGIRFRPSPPPSKEDIRRKTIKDAREQLATYAYLIQNGEQDLLPKNLDLSALIKIISDDSDYSEEDDSYKGTRRLQVNRPQDKSIAEIERAQKYFKKLNISGNMDSAFNSCIDYISEMYNPVIPPQPYNSPPPATPATNMIVDEPCKYYSNVPNPYNQDDTGKTHKEDENEVRIKKYTKRRNTPAPASSVNLLSSKDGHDSNRKNSADEISSMEIPPHKPKRPIPKHHQVRYVSASDGGSGSSSSDCDDHNSRSGTSASSSTRNVPNSSKHTSSRSDRPKSGTMSTNQGSSSRSLGYTASRLGHDRTSSDNTNVKSDRITWQMPTYLQNKGSSNSEAGTSRMQDLQFKDDGRMRITHRDSDSSSEEESNEASNRPHSSKELPKNAKDESHQRRYTTTKDKSSKPEEESNSEESDKAEENNESSSEEPASEESASGEQGSEDQASDSDESMDEKERNRRKTAMIRRRLFSTDGEEESDSSSGDSGLEVTYNAVRPVHSAAQNLRLKKRRRRE